MSNLLACLLVIGTLAWVSDQPEEQPGYHYGSDRPPENRHRTGDLPPFGFQMPPASVLPSGALGQATGNTLPSSGGSSLSPSQGTTLPATGTPGPLPPPGAGSASSNTQQLLNGVGLGSGGRSHDGRLHFTNYGYANDLTSDYNSNVLKIGNRNNPLNALSVAVSRDLIAKYNLKGGEAIYVNGQYIGNYDDTMSSRFSNTLDIYDPSGSLGANSFFETIPAGGWDISFGQPGSSPLPGVNPGDGGSSKIAGAAYSMIGSSTADVAETQGGALGCALGVCRIFESGTGQQLVPGKAYELDTAALYNSLSSDSRFTKLDITQAKPGDIIITARGSQAGHTGIVVDGGHIISNSSSGFNGSNPGTIQRNYTLDGWSSITSRNPGFTHVFRFLGN